MLARRLRGVFWNDDRGQARAPWLVALPLAGAFAVNIAVAAALDGAVPLAVLQLLTSVATVGVALALVVASKRLLGARRGLADYGLAVDRRWVVDLAAGFSIGLVGVSIPFLLGIALGWLEVVAILDPGAVGLWLGSVLILLAMLGVGLWEELVLRGVFVCNAADGLRRWLSARRALAGGVLLAAVVFGLGHFGQPENPAFVLTWILAGVVFGVIYAVSGNLALPIGAHAAFNTAYNVVFIRTDVPGTEDLSAISRIAVDPTLPYLGTGGVIEGVAFLMVGLLAVVWLGHSRGALTVDADDFQVEPDEPASSARAASPP